jgi:hypothetical protein
MNYRAYSALPRSCFAASLVLATGLRAAFGATDPSDRCDLAASQAANASGVPIDILLAITRVETARGGDDTRPWPWTINADGAGNWYATKAEAVAAASAYQTDGTATFDVGCFQLNIKWHGDGFASMSDMFDPTQNAAHAASFLAELYQESGDWATAVAAYHSRTPELAEDYLSKVKAVLNGPEADSAPLVDQTQTPTHENLFPLLQAGDQGSAGSLVPLQSARNPIIGGNS